MQRVGSDREEGGIAERMADQSQQRTRLPRGAKGTTASIFTTLTAAIGCVKGESTPFFVGFFFLSWSEGEGSDVSQAVERVHVKLRARQTPN